MIKEPTKDSSGRFSAPFQNLLGYEISHIEQDLGRVRLELVDEHMNPIGIPHGGIYATLLDVALGVSGSLDRLSGERLFAVTLNLNVNFVAPAKGSVLIAEGRRVGGGKSIYFAEGTVTDDKGTIIAHGTGSFKYLRKQG